MPSPSENLQRITSATSIPQLPPGNYAIYEVSLQLGFSVGNRYIKTGFLHNFVQIFDQSTGRVYLELNGLASTPTGPNSYTVSDVGFNPADKIQIYSTQESTGYFGNDPRIVRSSFVRSGSSTQIQSLINSVYQGAAESNALRLPYFPGGIMLNSNSANATILALMGESAPRPSELGQFAAPGSEYLVLKPQRIAQIRSANLLPAPDVGSTSPLGGYDGSEITQNGTEKFFIRRKDGSTEISVPPNYFNSQIEVVDKDQSGAIIKRVETSVYNFTPFATDIEAYDPLGNLTFVVSDVDFDGTLDAVSFGSRPAVAFSQSASTRPAMASLLSTALSRPQFASEAGATVGSTLGSYLARGDAARGLLYGTLLGEVGSRLGTFLRNGGELDGVFPTASADGLAQFGVEFQNRLLGAAAGTISSLLTVELANALGLEGFTGELFSSGTQSVLSKAISNVLTFDSSRIFDGFDFSQGLAGDGFSAGGAASLMASAVASFLGAKLGSLVVAPQNQAAVVLSSVGSSLGSLGGVAIGASYISAATGFGTLSLTPAIWALGNVVLPGVGAFVGFVLGALIGNLFGRSKPRIPTASAETILDTSVGQFRLGTVESANGGNADLVTNMALTARNALNQLLQQVSSGGSRAVVLTGATASQVYGHSGNDVYVRLGGGTTRTAAATPDEAVNTGAMWAIKQAQVAGGDLFLKRALQNSVTTDLVVLAGEMQVAADYGKYRRDPKVVSELIAAAYPDFDAATKAFYDNNKALVDKISVSGLSSLTTAELATYNAAGNPAKVAALVKSLDLQSQANPWIITLQKSLELKLDQWTNGDFNGGLKGFIDSFAFSGSGVSYQKVAATLVDGGLNLSVADSATGPFTSLVQSEDNGTNVRIADLSTIGFSLGASTTGTRGIQQGPLTDYTASTLNGGAGVDILIGGNAADLMYGGADADWGSGGWGADALYGNQGDDVLLGQGGNDYIHGGQGNDTIVGGFGPAPGSDDNDELHGGAGDDVIDGGGGVDQIYGDDGDDVVFGIPGVAVNGGLHGGAGSDTLSFRKATGSPSYRMFSEHPDGFENLEGSLGYDQLWGNGDANVLLGLEGDDALYGREGNDIVEGGAGADRLSGDDNSPQYGGYSGGSDTVSYEHSPGGVLIDIATGTAQGADAQGDVLDAFENVRGSAHQDFLRGNANANRIEGGGGDDYLRSSGGADFFAGGDGFDTLDFSTAPAAVTVNLGSSDPLHVVPGDSVRGYSQNQSSITGMEALIGSAYDDILVGDWGDHTFSGGPGNDVLYGDGYTPVGAKGSDTYLFGIGEGSDTIYDSNERWNVLYFKDGLTYDDLFINVPLSTTNLVFGIAGSTDQVTITNQFVGNRGPFNNVVKGLTVGVSGQVEVALTDFATAGGLGDDVFNQSKNKFGVQGLNNHNNLLFGYSGNDSIGTSAPFQWSDKANVVVGGKGDDIITSTSGDDTFVFERGNGRDVIFDSGGSDTILFGPSVVADDIIYEFKDGHLYIGLRDPASALKAASEVDDHLVTNGTEVINTTFNTSTRNFIEYVNVGGASINLSQLDLEWFQDFTDDPGTGGNLPPIVFDLGGDGLDLSTVQGSGLVAKSDSGVVARLSWVGPTEGMLAFDRNGDGVIDRGSEISFVQDRPGAKTDLEGLAAWDSNADRVLDAADPNWGKLRVWVDADQNGRSKASELRTLQQAGIVSLALTPQATGFRLGEGIESVVQNTTTFTRADNSTGKAYDVALALRLLGSAGPEDRADMKWSQFTGDVQFGVLLNEPETEASSKSSTSILSATGTQRSGLRYADVLAKAQTDFSKLALVSNAKGLRTWADRVDPVQIAARAALEARKFAGAEFLDEVKRITTTTPKTVTTPRVGALAADDMDMASLGGGSMSSSTSGEFAEAKPASPPAAGLDLTSSDSQSMRSFGELESMDGLAGSSSSLVIADDWWRNAGGMSTPTGPTGLLQSNLEIEGQASGNGLHLDAAAAQRQLLLRQGMAGFNAEGGGGSALWMHEALAAPLVVVPSVMTKAQSIAPAVAA